MNEETKARCRKTFEENVGQRLTPALINGMLMELGYFASTEAAGGAVGDAPAVPAGQGD